MLPTPFLVSTEQISRDISHFTIGFARLSTTDNVEDATSAGTATLVTVGLLHGVLTAAHVLDALPKNEKVGVILSANNPTQFQKQVINMGHAEPPVVIRGEKFGPIGPDLAFLKLTDETLGWLKAKCSFYNLSKRRDDVMAGKHPTPSYADTIVGIIHELTKAVPGERPRVRRVQFYTVFCGVRMSAVRYLKDRRLNFFQMNTNHEPDFPIPKSFQGTSGGAVWRFYVTKHADKVEIVDRRLIAVPFFEATASGGKPEITCHDARDIYGGLIDEITKRWPMETSQV